ncbi:MAG: tRNA pseudouridine(38-40) synthase TruA, partial [Spirochaetota bacterium]|nr:tRNA pseudouridine(38-40) synthase TruA [Spirochaetota bacterium]
LIYNHKQKSPFMINRALWVREELDLDFFRIASGYLIGEYDYTSFCKKGSSEKNTIRRIENINVTEQNHLIMFKVKGNSFLHNMVRIMVGTILEMSMNNISPSYMQEILEKRDRKFSGKTAPSYGLYLTKISFDIDLSEMESAF